MTEKEALGWAGELLAEAAEKKIYGQVVVQFVEGRVVLGRIEETRKPSTSAGKAPVDGQVRKA